MKYYLLLELVGKNLLPQRKNTGDLKMNKYIITTLAECDLTFSNEQTAQQYADKLNLKVCKVFYLDEHQPKHIGFGLENENGLIQGNEVYVSGAAR